MVSISADFRPLTDEQVQVVTGKNWQEWCTLIDTWGGQTKRLHLIANYLMERHHLRRLWAQMIAVYYRWEWCAQR